MEKKLFTPGPLGVSMTTKQAMLRDLGSRDTEFMEIVRSIRRKTVELAGTFQLFQSSIKQFIVQSRVLITRNCVM